MTFEPVYTFLLIRLNYRRHLAATLMLVLLLLGVLVPLLSLITVGVRELMLGLSWLREELGLRSLEDFSYQHLPLPLREAIETTLQVLHLTPSHLQAGITEALGILQKWAPRVLGFSVGAILDAILTLVAFYFFCVDGSRMVAYGTRLSPLSKEQNYAILDNFKNVTRGALLGSLVTAIMQSFIVISGFYFFGVPRVMFWGLLTLVVSFIPLVGASLVWGPAMATMILNGQATSGIAVGIYCAILIFIADHTIKPWIMHGIAALHPGLTFFAMIGGLAIFGLLGIIIGPTLLAFGLTVLRIYEQDILLRERLDDIE
jgi:predicted PurR-regulated permease PerM